MQVFNGFTAPQKDQPNEILKSPHGWGSRKLGPECCLFCPRKKRVEKNKDPQVKTHDLEINQRVV